MKTPATTSTRRWRRALLGLALGAFAALALSEIGVRVVLRARGKPFDADRAREALLLDVSRARDFVPRVTARDEVPVDDRAQQRFLHPYFGWEIHGCLDLLRAEAARLEDPRAKDDYEILLVGGSVAAVFGHQGWPTFRERLKADPRFAGKRLHLMPFAHGAYKEPQTIFLVQYMLAAGFTPDCVIVIDGFNDVAIANDNAARDVSPILPAVPQWTNLVMNGTADKECILLAAAIIEDQRSIVDWGQSTVDSGLHHSALVHTLVHRRMRSLQARVDAGAQRHLQLVLELSERAVLRGPPFEKTGSEPVRQAVRVWAECSRSIHAICADRGILCFQALQPTLHDEGAKPMSDEERGKCQMQPTWLEGVRSGYPLLRAEGARMRADGLGFVDASRIFAASEDTLYYDGCHFGEKGNRHLAEFLAVEFLARFPAPR